MFNQDWHGYSDTVRYRYESAWRTAEYEGLAALIRSMTHYSVYTPHTGIQVCNTYCPELTFRLGDKHL